MNLDHIFPSCYFFFKIIFEHLFVCEYILLCVFLFCVHVCLYTMCVKYVCEMPTDARQEVAQDPIGLELQTFLSCCVHAGN